MGGTVKINIVKPGMGPANNGAGEIVPKTGLFSAGVGAKEIAIIAVSVAIVLAIVAAIYIWYKRKHNADGEFGGRRSRYARNWAKAMGMGAVCLAVFAGVMAVLSVGDDDYETNAMTLAEPGTELSVEASDVDATIELGDEPVFAVVPVEVKVSEATAAGYTLKAYSDEASLVSDSDPAAKISIVTSEDVTELTDNTWGLALSEPTSQSDVIYHTISGEENATLITDKDYTGTKENDITIVYYGFYLTPGLPYGVYNGAIINYTAKANRTDLATVTFDGNGLYFNGDKTQTTNKVRYIPGKQSAPQYSHTPNINDEGIQNGKYGTDLNETFVYSFPGYDEVDFHIIKISGDAPWTVDDYFSIWPGDKPNNTALDDWDSDDSIKEFGSDGRYRFTDNDRDDYNNKRFLIEGGTITVSYTTDDSSGGGGGSGYGYYASVMGLVPNVAVSGEYKIPGTATYRDYRILGWSTDPDAGTPTYQNADEIATYLALEGRDTVLYAIWSPVVDISYDGNNATVGSMQSTSYDGDEPVTTVLAHEDKIADDNIDLYAPNYKKTGYGFAGWSTDWDAWNNLTDNDETNNPTIYGPNQSFTLTRDMALEVESGDMILYAVWVPAEENDGTPVTLQDWQGCSNLTATTYDSATGKLAVGKNTVTALTDNRDGNVYTVARLADGNCWMVENLRLGSEATISTANTNNPVTVNNYVAIKNNDGNTSAHLSPNSNSWCDSSISISRCFNQSYLNTNNTDFSDDSLVASYNNSDNAQWYSYGNYYNWYSATAGNGTYEKTSGEVAGDVCPAGWRLPIGDSNTPSSNISGSFYYLNQQMGRGTYASDSNNWRSFPNNFVYSGYRYALSTRGRGDRGYYYSSTAESTYHAYNLFISSEYVGDGPSGYFGKGDGRSVRCIILVQ